MRMGDCALTHRGFMTTFGPPQAPGDEGVCPEYVLMTDKVFEDRMRSNPYQAYVELESGVKMVIFRCRPRG